MNKQMFPGLMLKKPEVAILYRLGCNTILIIPWENVPWNSVGLISRWLYTDNSTAKEDFEG